MDYRTFYTERLFIRPVELGDAAFILQLLNTPKWLRFIGDRNVHSIEDAELYIMEKMFPQLEKLGFGNYIVIKKDDETVLGTCGLYDRPGLEGIDMGFAFLEEFEKKGYAYEASNKLLEAAFYAFEIPRIGAITLEENRASRNLLKKLGFTFNKYVMLTDEELMYYEIVKK